MDNMALHTHADNMITEQPELYKTVSNLPLFYCCL